MLEDFTDIQLACNIKNDKKVEQSIDELINRHSGIFYDILNTCCRKDHGTQSQRDISGEMKYIFYEAAMDYDTSKKMKFSTFLGQKTKWRCFGQNTYDKKHYYRNVELIENEEAPEEVQKTVDPKLIEKIFDIIKENPDQRLNKIFKHRYLDSDTNKVTPWKDIAPNIGLTIQGCINLHNKGIKILKQQIRNKENFEFSF